MEQQQTNHWGRGIVGKQMLGMPGSVITDVAPSAGYLMGGPDTHRNNDFTVSFRRQDGSEASIPKPWMWVDRQARFPDEKVTFNGSQPHNANSAGTKK